MRHFQKQILFAISNAQQIAGAPVLAGLWMSHDFRTRKDAHRDPLIAQRLFKSASGLMDHRGRIVFPAFVLVGTGSHQTHAFRVGDSAHFDGRLHGARSIVQSGKQMAVHVNER